jgi:hypothetical protein
MPKEAATTRSIPPRSSLFQLVAGSELDEEKDGRSGDHDESRRSFLRRRRRLALGRCVRSGCPKSKKPAGELEPARSRRQYWRED